MCVYLCVWVFFISTLIFFITTNIWYFLQPLKIIISIPARKFVKKNGLKRQNNHLVVMLFSVEINKACGKCFTCLYNNIYTCLTWRTPQLCTHKFVGVFKQTGGASQPSHSWVCRRQTFTASLCKFNQTHGISLPHLFLTVRMSTLLRTMQKITFKPFKTVF